MPLLCWVWTEMSTQLPVLRPVNSPLHPFHPTSSSSTTFLRPLSQATYYIPGRAAKAMNWMRPVRGVGRPRSKYDCPNEVCEDSFDRIEELAFHMTVSAIVC
jgi:hypothetical protein